MPNRTFNIIKKLTKESLVAVIFCLVFTLSIQILFVSFPIKATGDISKKGIDQTTQSETNTLPGHEIKWVISYKNSTGSVQSLILINDSIPVDTTFVPGSLKAPRDSIAEYSDDGGVNWSSTEPPSGVTDIRIIPIAVTSPSTSVSNRFNTPLDVVQIGQNGGQGHMAILYQDYVCSIYRHWPNRFTDAATPGINCFYKSSGLQMPNYPKYLSSTVGLDTPGSGDTNSNPSRDLMTSNRYDVFIRNGNVYFPAQRETDNGIACWSFNTDQNCGYTQLSTTGLGADFEHYSNIYGLVNVGDELFAFSYEKVLCMNLVTNSPCSGQPFSVASLGINYGDLSSYHNSAAKAFLLKNRYVFTSSSLRINLACFDTFTRTPCPNWTSFHTATGRGASMFYHYNTTTNAPDGVCISGEPGICYDENNNLLSYPSLIDERDSTYFFLPYDAEQIGSKTYIPNFLRSRQIQGQFEGMTTCYDWEISNWCTGFGTNGIATWNSNRTDVAYRYDPLTNCMYGNGNYGKIWTFNPVTGSEPCGSATINIKYNEQALYCDGTSMVSVYDKLKYIGGDSALNGVTTLILSVKDKNDILIKTGDLRPSGEISINDIPFGSNVSYGTITGLDTTELRVSGVSNQSGSVALGNQPVAIVLSTPKDPQICFNTIVSNSPTGTDISNTATLYTDTDIFSATTSLSLIVAIDLSLTKISSGGGDSRNGFIGKVYQGSIITYTLVATNNGSANANGNTVVVDTIPTGLTPLIDNGTNYTGSPNWICEYAAPNMTCTNTNSLPSGASTAVVLTAKVN